MDRQIDRVERDDRKDKKDRLINCDSDNFSQSILWAKVSTDLEQTGAGRIDTGWFVPEAEMFLQIWSDLGSDIIANQYTFITPIINRLLLLFPRLLDLMQSSWATQRVVQGSTSDSTYKLFQNWVGIRIPNQGSKLSETLFFSFFVCIGLQSDWHRFLQIMLLMCSSFAFHPTNSYMGRNKHRLLGWARIPCACFANFSLQPWEAWAKRCWN